jgi:hypothetical protein
MDQSQTAFLVQITDGYAFRNTMTIIRNETDHATMILSPNRIKISFSNRGNYAVHKITICASKLANYHYNIRDEDGELLPEYPIAFASDEMLNTTKPIGRRDGLLMYWIPGTNRISVQANKSKENGRAGAAFVTILNQEHTRHQTPKVYSKEPNVRVDAKAFGDWCAGAVSLKCSYLDIVGYPTSVTLKSMMSNGSLAAITNFKKAGDGLIPGPTMANNMQEVTQRLELLRVTDVAPSAPGPRLSLNIVRNEDLMTVRVPITTVKALSKIHNISPQGTLLRFYFSENHPTKIRSRIGTFGKYTVCLRNQRSS